MELTLIIALAVGIFATGAFSVLQSIKLKRAKTDQDLLRKQLDKALLDFANKNLSISKEELEIDRLQKESDRLKTLLQTEKERADLNLMWKSSFVELSNQTRWKRVVNKDHKFGEWEHINICKDADGVAYVATDNELEEIRGRALKHPEDFA